MEKETQMFLDYVKNYDKSDPAINWKIEHTFRVATYSRMLASTLNLDQEEIKRAYVIGMFHDIGRFEQIKRYNTFSDEKSIDHGLLGYEILKSLNYNDEIVLNAVRYHNAYKIPDEYKLDYLQNMHCMIIRDADKLDNLNCSYGEIKSKKINNELIKYFQKNVLVPNDCIKSDVDSAIRELSFVFDINFVESLNLIRNKNMIGTKIDNIYKQIDDDKIFIIEYFINEYIDKRIGVKKYGRVR